tara:strand:+ start:184 stop:438 length:255 start_codon:yes stop_codon:yes gene_type:complete
MFIFLLTNITKDISKIDLFGLIFGHIIFAVALTQLLDWSWLKNLMSEEDKNKVLNSYTWKDLVVDGGILTFFIGIIFIVFSIFL